MARCFLAMLVFTSVAFAQPVEPRPTPREAVAAFLEAGTEEDFARAAAFLEDRAATEAGARDLFAALQTALPGATQRGDFFTPDDFLVGTVDSATGSYQIHLHRQADGSWKFTRASVQNAPRILREFEETWVGRNLPAFCSTFQILGLALWQLVGLVGLWVGGVFVGGLVKRAIIRIDRWYAGRSEVEWVKGPLSMLAGPMRVFVALWVVRLFSPLLRLTASQQDNLNLVVRVLLVATVTWFVWRFITVGSRYLESFLDRGVDDPVKLRSIHTQVSVPASILRVIVLAVGSALVLLQFDGVRNVGLSLLASAGFAGVVIGLAAQRSIGNVLAGLQLAFFQPIKIGDVIEVEGAWGTVEEIGLTTVVVKVWDLRRLILPVSYFLEKPVWNWSKTTTDMLGAVVLSADYDTPIEEARAVLREALGASPLWDGKVGGLNVTAVTTEAIELRAVVSAADGKHLWDLRCHVRERMLEWLQRSGHLPMRRVTSTPARPE